MRRFFKEYFTLSKSERNGLIVLLIILGLVIILPTVIKLLYPREPLELQITTFEKKQSKQDNQSPTNLKLEPKAFNPNKISESGLVSMGIDTSIAQNIISYRNAGGEFYEKDDLLRIYGMTKEAYLALEPFIKLDDQNRRWGNNYKTNDQYEKFAGKIDVNIAGAEELQKISGIGPVFSNRIIEYREQIGGFDSLPQLLEVYGITDTIYNKVVSFMELSPVSKEVNENEVSATNPSTKLDLNTVDSVQLLEIRGIGPYFSSKIIAYREQLGGFHSIHQLYEIYNLDSNVVKRMKDRLVVDDARIRKINLNKADRETLQSHPYINRAVANFIISYRIDHLKIERLEELKSSYLVDDELLSKIAPYIEL